MPWCAQLQTARLLVSYRPLALPYNRDIMGKKNRRRDKGQFKLPSATSETSKKNLVSAIEERDPGYHRFHLTEPRYMVCSGCGMARYCSEECQRQHWPLHREQCMACQELISITPPAAGRELIKNVS